MTKLPKYTLEYDEYKDKWALENDKTNRVVRNFETKEQATKGGVLESVLGTNGGSVKIQKENGQFQEERTYPGSKDPAQSKG
jgi:hypothetical protein